MWWHDAQTLVVDLETTGLNPFGQHMIAGFALYDPDTENKVYLPVGHATGNLDYREVVNDLRTVLSDRERTYYAYNAKFDMRFLHAAGFPLLDNRVIYRDVMFAAHLVDETRQQRGLNYKLKDLAAQYVSPDADRASRELDALLLSRKYSKGDMWRLDASEAAEYAMQDVVITWQLWRFIEPYLAKWQVEDLWYENNRFASQVLLRMETNGVPVDRDIVMQHIVQSNEKATALLADIRKLAGYDINPNSPAQIRAFLHTPDATKKTLARMVGGPGAMINQYKQLTKAVGTFYMPYLEQSKYDGKLHPNFHVIGTVTGRLSSSEPNLQQVPRQAKNGDGYNVKDVFVAPDGWSILQADFAQLELRLACHFAGEKTMTDMFNNGEDLHQYTANQLGIDRHTGKTLNFGLLYGMGVTKAADFLNISEQDAKELVPGWHTLYPAFRRKHNQLVELANTPRNPDGTLNFANGYRFIRLPDGRVRRYLPTDNTFSSWNALIQGTGAILMRRALLAFIEQYPYHNGVVEPILTVHDSVILLVKDTHINQVAYDIRQAMRNFPEYNPGMDADVQVGKSWGSLKKYEIVGDTVRTNG